MHPPQKFSQLTLCCNARAHAHRNFQRYAICDKIGKLLWGGRFWDKDYSFNGKGDATDQDACELAVARKAIWFASMVRETIKPDVFQLTLQVPSEWMCTLKGRARILKNDSYRYKIYLKMEWVAPCDNLASPWLLGPNGRTWEANNLLSLAEPLITTNEKALDNTGQVLLPESDGGSEAG